MQHTTIQKLLSKRSSLLDSIGRAALRFYLYRENCYFDPRYNGEHRVLELLSAQKFEATTIFDIGANKGQWTAYARGFWPGANFHLFEPVPAIASLLNERFADDEQVTVHEFAVGSVDGEVEFHLDPERSTHSYVSTHISGTDVVPLLSGSTVFERLRLDRVDYCKIDAEGFDLDILHGLEPQLAARRISLIQFEHCGWMAYGRSFATTSQYLRDLGYRVGKIFPEGLREVEYGSDSWSSMTGPNFFAVSPDHNATFERLLTR